MLKFARVFQRIPKGMRLYYGVLGLYLLTTAMHIPDGYLSPVTCVVMFALVLPFWIRGVKKLRQKMNAKTAPLVALFAAFSFVIMMFNIPLPGGTTGHAVGGALAAIILGPDIACIAVSVALLIQAVFFGDGGILAFGANCFNMAVVLPYVSYAIYTALTRNSLLDSKKRVWASAVGAYIGLSAAAFFAAVEFGIQPGLFHSADGTPLYAPYPLSVSIPAMVLPHLLAASIVEAVFTAAVVAYLQKANQPALNINRQTRVSAETGGFLRWRILWIVLAVLAVLTPIGLLAPGTAWGEWGAQELAALGISNIPSGMAKFSSLWSAPAADYDLPSLGSTTAAYILSAIVGIVFVSVLVWLFVRLATSRKKVVKVEAQEK